MDPRAEATETAADHGVTGIPWAVLVPFFLLFLFLRLAARSCEVVGASSLIGELVGNEQELSRQLRK